MALGLYVVVLSAIIVPLSSRYEENSRELLLGAFVGTVLWQVSLLAFLLLFVGRVGNAWSLLGGRKPRLVTPSWYASVLGGVPWPITFAFLASLLARLATVVYVAVVSVFDSEFLLPEQQIPHEVFDDFLVQVVAGISIVAVAPVVEELFFRGFLFAGLRKLLGLWPAALISSVVFAVVHAQSGLVIPFTAVGLILAYLYHRSKSIYVPMAMHFFFNAVSFLAMVFLPELRVDE